MLINMRKEIFLSAWQLVHLLETLTRFQVPLLERCWIKNLKGRGNTLELSGSLGNLGKILSGLLSFEEDQRPTTNTVCPGSAGMNQGFLTCPSLYNGQLKKAKTFCPPDLITCSPNTSVQCGKTARKFGGVKLLEGLTGTTTYLHCLQGEIT